MRFLQGRGGQTSSASRIAKRFTLDGEDSATPAYRSTIFSFFWWYNSPMNKQEILNRLRNNERALRARGVTHAALFGSRARGDNRPDSDIDILIEIEPEAVIDLFDYVGITQFIDDLFPTRVDVANRAALKSFVRPDAERDAIYAF